MIRRSEYGDAWVEGRGRALPDVLEAVRQVEEAREVPSVRVRVENGRAGSETTSALLRRGFQVTGLEREGDRVHLMLGKAVRQPLTRPRVLPPQSLRVVVVWWELLRGQWHVLLGEHGPPLSEPYLHETLGQTVGRVLIQACSERLDHEGIVGLGWGPLQAGRTVLHVYVRVRPDWQTTAVAEAMRLRDVAWTPAEDVPDTWARLLDLREAVPLGQVEDELGSLHLVHPTVSPW